MSKKKIEIRNRWTNKIIVSGKYESIKDCLEKNKGANLSGADLSWANLSGADLSWANLSGANLSGADLSKIPQLNTPTLNEYISTHKIKQKGKYIFVFKGVSDSLESPRANKKLKYNKGVVEVKYADSDVWADCSFGISLSPTIEVAKKWGTKVIKVKVDIGDIACIPICDNVSKFRVKKCEVLGKITK